MPLTGEDRIEDDPVLGAVVDNFPSRRLPALFVGWSFLIGLSLIINLALWNYDAAWVSTVVVLFIGTVALLVGWRIMHLWNREVILYERGFTYREGSQNVPFLYAEIARIRLRAERLSTFGGLYKRNIYRITVTTYAGDQVRLTNVYNRIQELSDELIEQANTWLRPAIQQRLELGEWVYFSDAFKLSQSGLAVDASAIGADADAFLPWLAFSGYRVKNRKLMLITDQETVWFALGLAEIDNLTLLLEFLKRPPS